METLDHGTTLRLLRYLGGEADANEVAALDALFLENEAARAALLDLAWQAQSLRDLAPEAPAVARRFPVRTLAAVAACLALLFIVLRPNPEPPLATAAITPPRIDWTACFERDVSWNDVYPSVLLFPRFVWNQFLGETPASFPSFGEDYPLLAQGPIPSETHAFDHIRVIPLPETFSPYGSGEFPAL